MVGAGLYTRAMAAETMRAMAYSRYGGNEVLELMDLPMPKVGPGEVLVRVRSAAVNPVDWKIMAGGLDALMTSVFPIVPGWDVAGVVERVGIDVPEFSAGEAVLAYNRKDFVHDGTFAEFVSVPVRSLAAKPPSVGWDEAAALPLAGLTAYQVLIRLGAERGQTVLVHGAGGGVGSMGVQIAAGMGLRVIGTASTVNHDRIRALGAEPVAYGDGLAERVRSLAPTGVDLVADFVGGVLDTTVAVLAPGGRHASIADDSVTAAGGSWVWVRPSGPDLSHLAALVERGDVAVPIAGVFDLDHLAEAFDASRGGRSQGKLVVRISTD